MRGRNKIKKPVVALESRYNDPLVTKLINKVMWSGKKQTAEAIVYDVLERLAKENKAEPQSILKDVLEKASPILEVRSRRVGGATYQVPIEVKPARKTILVIRWILEAARNQKGRNMTDALYTEMKNILEDTGTVMKRREDLHKMAESNRAFAHFARY